MRKLLLLGSLVAVLSPVSSRAQVDLGLRAGFAFGMGDAAANAKLSDAVKWQIPIQLDALYRLTPELSLGGYGSYGFGILGDPLNDACDAVNADCSASSWRVGVQAAYALNQLRSATLSPWVAVGTGWEWLKVESAGADTTSNGWEYVNLQLGADYKANKQLAVGPFVQFSVGQFRKIEGNDIPDKGTHEWLTIGLRGLFAL
jgi:hypothetical protein